MAEERKRFLIPNQISKSFHIWRGITLREGLILLPLGLLGYLCYQYFVPNSWDLSYRLFAALLPVTLGGAMLFVRPIPERKNIALYQQLLWRIRFNRRQRVYPFSKGKMRGVGE
ncbi:hypothetical protein MK805_08790 [Shimazuella sp. AN120528]|uniref:hypothetical protein n=1 Tax=Shimazuella soli TaxID=1892854 RepID=UPI001F102286|nr:hypothetical protein [Shimazuella soli]MCH5585065.1 hypothetical protein [Shimazuella soli]